MADFGIVNKDGTTNIHQETTLPLHSEYKNNIQEFIKNKINL